MLPHIPYSPDLVPSDYFIFPNLKNDSMVNDLLTMKKWSLQLMGILRKSTVLTINRVTKLLNITGKSVYRAEWILC